MSNIALPILHWVDANETTFGPEHHSNGEDVLSINCEHSEGQKATLSVEVRNPRRGLLPNITDPDRKIYVWVSVELESGIVPIFFGRLIGIPTNIFQEVVTLSFISEHPDWIYLKQVAAEPLKIRPYYDPVFLDPIHRDDPDSIIEGYSALWHFDRVSLAIQISDYLDGEDGNEVFTDDDPFYDNVEMTLEQAPLTAENLNGTVKWNQRANGIRGFGPGAVKTYTGGALISGWPQPLADLGGGWRVVASPNAWAMDVYGINRAFTYSGSFSYQNNADNHQFGDTMSVNESFSFPSYGGNVDGDRYLITSENQIAYVDQDPDFKDIQPASSKNTYFYVPLWLVNASFIAKYEAQRARTEHAVITMTVDLQQIITQSVSPLLPIEEITQKNGIDVGTPLINVLNWHSVRNRTVQFGQVIYPNNPSFPGGTSLQICTTGGLTGNGAIPLFSPITGDQTIDNEVIWTSMGASDGSTVADWSADTYFPIGQIIRPTDGPWYDYYISQETTDIFGLPVIHLGFLPDGNHYFVCIQSGFTKLVEDNDPPPTLTGPAGTIIPDGSVIWKSLGTGLESDPFIYLPIGYPGRRSYFPTDRGHWSLEYLLSVSRAHLRLRSRTVKISFDCTFERAIALSCRKTVTIHDHRFPGGVATGKIVAYSFKCDGDKEVFIGRVTIGCAVGQDGHPASEDGEPVYVELGYVDPGYQLMDGSIIIPNSNDLTYNSPADDQNDRSLTFPFGRGVVVKELMHGNIETQKSAIDAAVDLMRRNANLQLRTGGHLTFEQQKQMAYDAYFSVENELSQRANSIWYELELRSAIEAPFENQYNIQSVLNIQKQIDLSAPST